MPTTIETDSLYFKFVGKDALRGVTLSITPAKITALVGPNGAGKTTLLRCLAALELPFSGKVLVNQIDTRLSPHDCHPYIGYLSDSFGLYDRLTVAQCLDHAAEIRGIFDNQKRTAIKRVVELLHLGTILDQLAGTLSRGQRQRVAIAQAIIHNPQILLLDEPASGLDPQARRDLSTLLCLLRDQGVTIIVSSHILAELEDYSDMMLTIDKGKILGYVRLKSQEETGRHLRISVLEGQISLKQALASVPHVTEITHDVEHIYFRFSGNQEEQITLIRTLYQDGHKILSFTEEKRTMQSVYFEQVTAKEQ